MKPAYNHDLAYIHDTGFGHLATHAAPVIIETLLRSGIDSGTVVDLGCGSGITSRLFRDAGFHVVGIDLSEAMIALAQKRVPEGDFRVGSFVEAELPPCVCLAAIGEVFNYAFDSANDPQARSRVIERIHGALQPGGVLAFDIAGPQRAPDPSPSRNFAQGPDWAVLVEIETDEGRTVLTRRITSFRKEKALYRRDFEIHCLQLIDPQETEAALRRLGFTVEQLGNYGPLQLPAGLTGFLARKAATEQLEPKIR